MSLENIPENSYEFDEQIEVRDDFRRQLLILRHGFTWAIKLTSKEQSVCYYRVFEKKTFREISNILDMSTHRAWQLWKNGIAKSEDIFFKSVDQ